jgi:hypothetical protein
MGVLVMMFAVYTAPGGELRKAPESISEIENFVASARRPICVGGKVGYKTCLGGKISSTGANIEDRHCAGKNWVVCAACAGAGKLRDVLVIPVSQERL